MNDLLRNERDADSIAIVPIGADRLEEWRANAVPEASAWVGRTGFSAKPGSTCLVPGRGGRLASVLAGVDAGDDPWALAHVPEAIPAGAYHLDLKWSSRGLERTALGWAPRRVSLRAVQEGDATRPRCSSPGPRQPPTRRAGRPGRWPASAISSTPRRAT